MKWIRKGWILLLWLFLWQVLEWKLNLDILIAGPMDTILALQRVIGEELFWNAIVSSMGKILKGFFIALLLGSLLGVIGFRFCFIGEFLEPAMNFLRSVPVASFIVLALLWVGSQKLSILIAFVIAFPIFYEGMLSGLSQADKKLLEMCQVFSVSLWCKACTVYWYQLFPVLRMSCKNAMGMAWKAGIAAEVIGVPDHSLGEKLYYAKIYLNTGELFAWTVVIMLCSAITSIGIDWMLQLFHKMLCHFPGISTGKELLEKPDIVLKHVEKQYGTLKILKQFSAYIPYGTTVAIRGESGVGKTTLLRLIAGLEAMDEGILENNNGKMAMVFQENRLLEPLTGWQNCRIATSIEKKGYSKETLCSVLAEILPSSCLNQPVSQFSGGMKRRVAIARAMLSASHIIILDEPFTGLDEETRKNVIAFIQKYRKGRTILFTTHREDDVAELEADFCIQL